MFVLRPSSRRQSFLARARAQVSTGAGDVAATEANDTAALAGQVLVAGTIAATETNDSAAIAGQVLVAGTIAATETNDTAAIAGDVTAVAIGDVSATETNDTAALTGTLAVSGNIAATENSDALAAFSGAPTAAGDIAATEANDTAALAGTVLPVIEGTLAAIEANDTAALAGTVLPVIEGTLAATEADDTLVATGVVLGVIDSDIAATEANDTMVGVGGEPSDQIPGFYPFARRMPAIDALIFNHVGDVALVGSTHFKGIFNNRYREVELNNGAVVGLDISFDTQISPLIANLKRNDRVRIEGKAYRFGRRIPEYGDETGLVILELLTLPPPPVVAQVSGSDSDDAIELEGEVA